VRNEGTIEAYRALKFGTLATATFNNVLDTDVGVAQLATGRAGCIAAVTALVEAIP